MNKTIIININGIVFHIEEDAYETLKNYMTDIKRHFMNSADSIEITTDIENRIAEMFNELLANEHKQVIVEQDVAAIIEQMGTVKDFENADEETKTTFGSYPYQAEARRLFRDPDDHLVGGVCAGIANYFEVSPVWIRLAFAISVAFAGSGFFLYIILWIVMPKAITRADRMAMKGEKLNLQGFKKNFEEEISNVRGHFSNFQAETRPLIYKTRDFIGDFFHHLGIFLSSAGKVIVKLLGVFILLSCLAISVFLIVGLVALLAFGSFAPFRDLPVNLLKHNHADYIYISAFLVAFIPVLSIILLTLKGIFNASSVSRSSGSIALVTWLLALGVLVYHIAKITGEFRSFERVTETLNITPTKGNVYYLKLNDLKYFSAQDSARLDIKSLSPNIKITEDPDEYADFNTFQYRRVHLAIEKSDVSQPVLVETFKARGRNDYDALANARDIKYIFLQQDSVLKFDYRLYPSKNDDLWHDEELDITLRIPLKSTVVIDQRLNNILEGVNINDCKVSNRQQNTSSANFVMTDNGLQCKVDTLITDSVAKKKSIKTDSLTTNH